MRRPSPTSNEHVISSLEGLLRRLLCQGDVDSLRSAQYVAKGMGLTQAREQASTPASIPDRVGSSSHRYPGVVQQVPQQPPLTLEQLRQQRKAVYAEADQVCSKWSQLREDVRSKRRELDAVLASRQGVQQPAVSSSIDSYENLLLQYRDIIKEEYQTSQALRSAWRAGSKNSQAIRDAQLAQQQQQKRKHNSRGRKQKDSSSTARTASGRVAKQPTSVGAAAQRLAQLCLRQQ